MENSLVRKSKSRWHLMIAVVVCLVSACINTPLPDYYVLTPERLVTADSADLAIDSRVALGIGPITIPETVNRPNIVTPLDSNQVEVAEYHRWSEPLIENISRVVITNLAGRTGLDKLYAYPWLGNDVTYQVRMDVLQMTGTPGQGVLLQVRWQILTGEKPRQLLMTRIREYRETVVEGGYSALVSAYSRAVAAMSNDIAGAVRSVASGPS